MDAIACVAYFIDPVGRSMRSSSSLQVGLEGFSVPEDAISCADHKDRLDAIISLTSQKRLPEAKSQLSTLSQAHNRCACSQFAAGFIALTGADYNRAMAHFRGAANRGYNIGWSTYFIYNALVHLADDKGAFRVAGELLAMPEMQQAQFMEEIRAAYPVLSARLTKGNDDQQKPPQEAPQEAPRALGRAVREAGPKQPTLYRSLDQMNGEPTVNMFLREVVKLGDTVFDLGAHMGWLTTVMSRLVGPSGRVIAFEPSPIVQDLVFNLHQQFCQNVYVENTAVGHQTGSAPFLAHANTVSGRIATAKEADHALRVPMWSLDDYCEETGLYPTLIKMDLEGYESNAIRGAARLIAAKHPLIIFEQDKADLSAIALLKEFGYNITDLHDYLPCETAESFRGVVRNLVAWRREHNIFLDALTIEEVSSVPFRPAANGNGVETGPLALEPGRYILTGDIPGADAGVGDAIVSYGIDHDGREINSDATLYWLALSYKDMPWFSRTRSAPNLRIRGLHQPIKGPSIARPVTIKRLVSGRASSA